MKRPRSSLAMVWGLRLFGALVAICAARWYVCHAPSSVSGDSPLQADGQTNRTLLAGLAVPDSTMQSDATGEVSETNSDEDPLEDVNPPWEIQIGDYTVKTEREVTNGETSALLEVWKAGALLYSVEGYRFEIPVDNEEGETNDFFRPGTNITGNGIPNLVVSDYSGGAHCCYTFYIFELGDEFRLIDEISAEHGGIDLVDLNHNGVPAIKMSDWSYAYVFGCFASSPAPEVILQYANGHYAMATNLMAKPAPTEADLQEWAADIKTNHPSADQSEWAADTGLYQKMLDLIYSGNEDQARRLFDLAWPEEEGGKEEALSEFVDAVSGSFYWQAVYGSDGERDTGVILKELSEP